MSPADIVLIIIIAAAVTAALIRTVKNFGKCSCTDCCGSCEKCRCDTQK